jgi:hypothetical protein
LKVTIHQPEHLVWIGLLGKIAAADLFVLLDTVQYKKGNFQNRNRIRTSNGWTWLTVPIKKMPHRTLIKDVQISHDQPWIDSYMRRLAVSYNRCKYYHEYYESIDIALRSNNHSLSSLNIVLLKQFMKWFDIKTEMRITSETNVGIISGPTEVNLEICKSVGATQYIAGTGSEAYLDLDKFHDCGIGVSLYNFTHPVYKQIYEPFIPKMSSIDLLFNHGPKSIRILNNLK